MKVVAETVKLLARFATNHDARVRSLFATHAHDDRLAGFLAATPWHMAPTPPLGPYVGMSDEVVTTLFVT